ncbi:5-hydroxyisourate hydrolase [Lysinibacillus sp. PLM2]|nr:5-hydroxyisourate hydrolase [Lysinibacillus sp. PLM2]
MPSLSTHVLDLYHGHPAKNVRIDLYFLVEAEYLLLKTIYTNEDGRCTEPLITNETFKQGTYELVFYVEDYFRVTGVTLSTPNFLSTVPVRFQMQENQAHYHVPLLVTPWGYQVYRGS